MFYFSIAFLAFTWIIIMGFFCWVIYLAISGIMKHTTKEKVYPERKESISDLLQEARDLANQRTTKPKKEKEERGYSSSSYKSSSIYDSDSSYSSYSDYSSWGDSSSSGSDCGSSDSGGGGCD